MRGYNLAITGKKFEGNTLNLQYKNIAKSFRVGYFFTHPVCVIVWVMRTC